MGSTIPVDRWVDVMRAFGCNVVEVPGWETRGRPYPATNEFVMGHHTAGPWTISEKRQIELSNAGRQGVPGPHYAALIGYTVPTATFLCAAGYTNNAGRGLSAVLARMRAGQRPLGLARTVYGAAGGRGDISQNGPFRAVSYMGGTTSSTATPAMLDEMARATAAFIYIDGQPDPDTDIGAKYLEHREWTSRKIDPTGSTPDEQRTRIWQAYRTGWLALHQPPAPEPPYRIRDARGVRRPLSGEGWWVVASDGAVFAYGGAPFHGSLGDVSLDAPIVDLVPTDGGYYLIGADGGVFAFNAPFHGSAAGRLGDSIAVGGFIGPDGRLRVVTDAAGQVIDPAIPGA